MTRCKATKGVLKYAAMKAKIHPTYHAKAQVECACGNKFTIGSTLEKIRVEICSGCHPFFTGEEKVMDMGGRVERFKKRTEAGTTKPKAAKKSKSKA